MKIALIHDYLREYGGAERVVEVLHEMYPAAPLYTSFVDWDALGDHAHRFKSWDIRTSWVDRNWLVKKYHSPLRFLTPFVWKSFDLSGFDVVISSSGWFICRGVVTLPKTVHISYIHHPPRNLYGYPTGRSKSRLVRMYSAIINPFLRVYDFTTAQRVQYLVANSEETKARIKKIYKRDATVIYPPVTVNTKSEARNSKVNKTYFLSVGRLSYAKRVDLAILACNKLHVPLKIVGVGSEMEYLKTLAGSTVEFLGGVSDTQLGEIYRNARALIFCALDEDFGMVPVEAQATGRPVIALNQGGVKETVLEGKTGVFFEKPTVDSLLQALEKFSAIEKQLTPENCLMQAKKFSKREFMKKMHQFVFNAYTKHQAEIKG